MAPQLLHIVMVASHTIKKGAFKCRDFVNPSSSQAPNNPSLSLLSGRKLFFNTVPFLKNLLESRENN